MFRINKKSVFVTLFIVFIVILSNQLWSDNETIKIGGAFGLSGQCAEFGEGEMRSAQLAIDEVNSNGGIGGKKIELVIENTECEYKSTFNAINKLINVDRVKLIIGPTWGDSFQSAVPLINKSKVVTISPSAAMEAILLQKQPVDYYYSTWFSGNSEISSIQEYMMSVGQKNVVVVHDQDPFGVLMSVIFANLSKQKGINLVHDYDSVTNTEDYRVILSKIKSDKPDAVFMSFIGPESKVKFLKQAREFGIDVPMYSASDIQNETLLASFGKYMEGVVYSFPRTTGKYESFVEKYEKKYGSKPQGPSAANAYDAAMAAVHTLSKSAENLSPENIKKNIDSISIPGFSVENVSFNENHQMKKSESSIKTVKNGKFVEVK